MPLDLVTWLKTNTKAQRTSHVEGFRSKQKHLSYPAWDSMVLRRKKGTAAEIEKSWHLDPIDAGPDSVQAYGAFGRITNRRVEGVIELAIKLTMFVSHTNCIHDEFVQENFNKRGSDGHQYSLKDSDEDKALKAFVQLFDRALLDAPTNPGGTEGLGAILGALYWGALSQDSSGNYVPQPTPARNGIYATLGDNTVTSTILGQNRALIANECLRSVVGTRSPGKINADDCEALARILALQNYSFIAGLKGRVGSMPSHEIFLSWDDEQDYRAMLNQLSGDRGDDYFKLSNGQRMDGRVIRGSQNMPRASIRPILVVNHNELKLRTAVWGQSRPHRLNENVVTNNQYYIAQVQAEDPSTAVAVMHGSW